MSSSLRETDVVKVYLQLSLYSPRELPKSCFLPCLLDDGSIERSPTKVCTLDGTSSTLPDPVHRNHSALISSLNHQIYVI